MPLFERLAAQDRFKVHTLTDVPAEADVILFVDARHEHNDWQLKAIRRHPLVSRYREKAFVYNEMDQPWCAMPGLYVSMPRQSFNWQRQRACCYANNVNHYVEEINHDHSEPDILFSFVGRRCHWTRDRILQMSHSRAYIEDTSDFNFFGTSGEKFEKQKQHYAAIVQRSKFVLCPRGAGPSSFRLFEIMAAGRVPVVLSDEWVAPSGPKWNDFMMWLPEARVDDLPAILESQEERYETMAVAARRAWEDWFAPDVLFHRMAEGCQDIVLCRRLPEAFWHRTVSLRYLRVSARYIKKYMTEQIQRAKSSAKRVE